MKEPMKLDRDVQIMQLNPRAQVPGGIRNTQKLKELYEKWKGRLPIPVDGKLKGKPVHGKIVALRLVDEGSRVVGDIEWDPEA